MMWRLGALIVFGALSQSVSSAPKQVHDELVQAYDEQVRLGNLQSALGVLDALEAVGLSFFSELERARLLMLTNRQEEGLAYAVAAIDASNLSEDHKANLRSNFSSQSVAAFDVHGGITSTYARNPLSETSATQTVVSGQTVSIRNYDDGAYSSGYRIWFGIESPRLERFGKHLSLSVAHESYPSEEWTKLSSNMELGRRIDYRLGRVSLSPMITLGIEKVENRTTRVSPGAGIRNTYFLQGGDSFHLNAFVFRDRFPVAKHMTANRIAVDTTFTRGLGSGAYAVNLGFVDSSAIERDSSYRKHSIGLTGSFATRFGEFSMPARFERTLFKGEHFFFGTRRAQKVTSLTVQWIPAKYRLGPLKPKVSISAVRSRSNQFTYQYKTNELSVGLAW